MMRKKRFLKYKKDIPKIGKIEEIITEEEFEEKFKYPKNSVKADYYVKYILTHPNLGVVWLIEASKKRLDRELKQLEESARIFKSLNVKIDNYLLVLNSIDRRSKKLYKTEPFTLKPLKTIYKKINEKSLKMYKINSKRVFLIYRDDFKLLEK